MQIPPAISSVPKLEPASLQSLCMQTEPRFLVWGLAHRPRLSFFRSARLVKCPAGRSACRYVSLHCGSSRKQENNHSQQVQDATGWSLELCRVRSMDEDQTFNQPCIRRLRVLRSNLQLLSCLRSRDVGPFQIFVPLSKWKCRI